MMRILFLVLAIATVFPNLAGCGATQSRSNSAATPSVSPPDNSPVSSPVSSPANAPVNSAPVSTPSPVPAEKFVSSSPVVSPSSSAIAAQVLTLKNEDWTLEIGGLQNWSGVNGTGNSTYRGCDVQGKCLTLTGGKTSCRDGLCVTAWQNGEYVYAIESIQNTSGGARDIGSRTTLVVRKDNTEVVRTGGFRSVVP